MRRIVVLLGLAGVIAALAAIPTGAVAAPAYHECQHPVMTGVEVSSLHDVSTATACPVALSLFRWEDTENHETVLYGCRHTFHPYLRLHTYDGWKLSLRPAFTMTRGSSSFVVSGTDFPINCT